MNWNSLAKRLQNCFAHKSDVEAAAVGRSPILGAHRPQVEQVRRDQGQRERQRGPGDAVLKKAPVNCPQ